MKFAATIGCLHKIKIYYKCLWNCLFLSASKTLCSLCIRMLLVNVTSMWTLALNLSMNSGHLLGSQSNLRTSIGCKLRESIFFCRITLILLLVRLSALTTVSLPSVNSSINASMVTTLGALLLFSEAKDKHGISFIVSISGFEILFESGVNNDCLFWFGIGIYCFKFWTIIRKIIYVILGGCFCTNGSFELVGALLGWSAATGLLVV